MKIFRCLVVLTILLTTACGSGDQEPKATETAPPTTGTTSEQGTAPASAQTTTWSEASAVASGVVDEAGLSVELDRVQVSAPAGVAAPGTTVTVSTPHKDTPAEASAIAGMVGNPVRVVLGDNQQPAERVTIVLDLAGTELGDRVSAETPLAVLSVPEGGGASEWQTGTWDPDAQTYTMVTEHLSWKWPTLLDPGRMWQSVREELLLASGSTTRAPDCFGESLVVSGYEYVVEEVPYQAVWPCLRSDEGGINLELHANSAVPWRVRTDPPVVGSVEVDDAQGSAMARVFNDFLRPPGSQDTIVLPGASTTLAFSPSDPPRTISADRDARLLGVAALLWSVETVMEQAGIKEPLSTFIFKGSTAAECLNQAVEGSGAQEPQAMIAPAVGAVLNCLQLATTGFPGLMLSILTDWPGLISGVMEDRVLASHQIGTITFGINRTLTGQGTQSGAQGEGGTITPDPDCIPVTPSVGATVFEGYCEYAALTPEPTQLPGSECGSDLGGFTPAATLPAASRGDGTFEGYSTVPSPTAPRRADGTFEGYSTSTAVTRGDGIIEVFPTVPAATECVSDWGAWSPVATKPAASEQTPEGVVTFELEDRRDGYRGKVTVEIFPEVESSTLPVGCNEDPWVPPAGPNAIYRANVVRLKFESIPTNGFDWPTTLPVEVAVDDVNDNGFLPYPCDVDLILGEATYLYPGDVVTWTMVQRTDKTPNQPDGDWSVFSPVTVILHINQDFCDAADGTGVHTDWVNDFAWSACKVSLE